MTTHSSESEPGSISHLWQQCRNGDSYASSELYQRLIPRMYAVARRSIGPIAQRGVEADDVVQSAMISFFKYSTGDKLSLNKNRHDLWSLVATFTARKASEYFRRERTQKRGGGKVLGEHALRDQNGDGQKMDELVQQLPVQEFDLLLEELLAPFDEELTRIVLLKMSAYTQREIAQMLGCTERKIERKLERARAEFSQLIEQEA